MLRSTLRFPAGQSTGVPRAFVSSHREQDRYRYNDTYRNDTYRNDNYRYDNGGYSGGYYDGGYRDSGYRSSGNQWRDIAIASGALAVIGLLEHDRYLTFGGAAGALYALSRYNDDRSCNDPYRRARARYFDQSYFMRDGHRFERRIVNQGSNRYYQFVRCD